MAVLAAAMVLPVCAQDSAPASGSAKTAPAAPAAAEQPNPVRDRWAHYKSDLSQADRGKWVTELQPQMGLGTEVKEEAQFWYGLNAQKLEHARWQQLGRTALAQLIKDGKTEWKTRARNANVEAQLTAIPPDCDELTLAKRLLDQELAGAPKSMVAVETAVTLARVSRALNDTDTAQKAAKYAAEIAKYVDYKGIFTLEELAALQKDYGDANKVAKTPDIQREFDLAEKIMQASRYEEAIVCYEGIIKIYPDHILARKSELRVCECLFYHEDFLPAQVKLLALLQKDPKGPYRAQMHLLMGDIYLEHDFRLPQANREYDAVFHPDDYAEPDPKKDRPKLADAAKLGKTVLQTQAHNQNVVKGEDPLAPMLEAAKDPANKEAKIRQYLPKGVDATWAEALSYGQVRLGLIAYMTGDFESADKYFQEAYQLNPITDKKGTPNPVVFLSDYCRNKSLPLESWALKEGDEQARVALFVGALYVRTSQPKKGEAILRRVAGGELKYASLDQRAMAQNLLGEALFKQGEEKKAQIVWRAFQNPPLSQSKAAPDALLQLGCTTQDLDVLAIIYQRYPRTEQALAAQVQRGFGLICKGENREALALMKTAAASSQEGWGVRAKSWIPLLEEKIKRGGPWKLNEEILARDNPRMAKVYGELYKVDMAGNPYLAHGEVEK